ncbi:MAG: class I SAM-dependent methyltransferase, partial [Vicinamibacteria bacterium]|nr:class I SAM-dependent methyltransferase [Vicinamibacteria bacterium]
VEGILNLFPALTSVSDFGCGTGAYVAEFRKRHVAAKGFEYSPIARRLAKDEFRVEVQPFDLATFTGAGDTFDLAMSFEVAEHLTPSMGHRLVEVCCQHAPLVVFSAASPGQPGQGHIHLQPKSYWIERFARHGFLFNPAKTAEMERHLRKNLIRGFWLADNIGVFESERSRTRGDAAIQATGG